MTIVKICGLTTFEDALAAARAGADMIAFNFFKRSPRYIAPEQAKTLVQSLRAELGAACPLLIGLFVNEVVSRVSVTIGQVGLKAAQLSGDESTEMLRELRGTAYKSIRPRSRAEALEDVAYFLPNSPGAEHLPSLLVDAYHPGVYGGTGIQVNLEVAQAVREKTPRMMLAGGLNPDNVGEVVRVVMPWGVDVASGVELEGQPGRKDPAKMRAFVQAAKSALPA